MKSAVWKVRIPVTVIGFGLFVLMFISTVSASASGFAPGDLLVAMTNGNVEVRSAVDGTLKTTLVGPIQAPAKGLAIDGFGNLLVAYWWTPDHSAGNTVVEFSPNGTVVGTFGTGYFCQPSGIAVDGIGDVFVGESECDGNLLEFNSAGSSTEIFAPTIENGGVRWIDLEGDGCTMLYTSAGFNVERFNVCTGTQLSNFTSSPLPLASGALALGLRHMPDGGVMVAATYDIKRLDASGNIIDTYTAPGDFGLVNIWLDSDGTSFWATSFETGTAYKFDIASHNILLSFNNGATDTGDKGIIIVPPQSIPPGPPPPSSVPGRMTGGGTFAAADGTIVSHGFQLRCNAQDPRQNLEVNWGKGQNFHLETVTSVTCFDNPAINPANPDAPFDTMVLTGTGKFNNQNGATISLIFSDAGEPGTNDGVQMVIMDASGNVVLNVPATTLISGNQQAHRATGKQF